MSSSSKLLSARPPVTEHEARLIHKIVEALNESETFYLSGTLDLGALGIDQPALLYTINDLNGDIQGSKALSLHEPQSHVLDELHADCDPSPFGQGKETVYDESYRLARELQSNRLGLNFDPTAVSTGVLAAVSAFTTPTAESDTRESNLRATGVEAKLYKLNSYTTGGHFKKHRDTPKATNHIGTLLFGIPTPFEGGELILTHGSVSEADGSSEEPRTVTIDWSKVDEPDESSASSVILPWVFFYSDVEHEILPVKSGHRLTISYDIFATEMVRYRVPGDPNKFKARSDTLYKEFLEVLTDEDFLNKGGRLAFALSYEYPAKEMEDIKDAAFDAILKGNDYLLLHTLASLSLTPGVRAVYELQELPRGYYRAQLKALSESGMTGYTLDRFSSLRRRGDSDSENSEPDVLLTGLSFGGMDEDFYDDETTSPQERAQALMESTEGSVDWALIWARRPTKTAWAVASTYMQYGNCASTAYSYVAGALVIDVPAFGEGARKVTK